MGWPKGKPGVWAGKKRPPRSPEWCARIGDVHRGKIVSAETREKLRAAVLGKPAPAGRGWPKGTPWTQSHRDKAIAGLRASAWNLQRADHARRVHSGRKRPPETGARISASLKAKWKNDPVYAARLREIIREARKKSSGPPIGHEPYFAKHKFYYRDIEFRSSYEVRVAKALDALGIRWEFEQHRFSLGINKTYRPDFYLPDGGCYWEVKGYYGPKSRRTIALFRACYPNEILIVVNESAMKALERAAIQRAA